MLAGNRKTKKLRGPVSEPAPETPPAEEAPSPAVNPEPRKLAGKNMAAVEEAVTLPAGGQGAAVTSEAVTLPTPIGKRDNAIESVTLPTPIGKRDNAIESVAFERMKNKLKPPKREIDPGKDAGGKFQSMLNRIKQITTG